MDRVVLPRAVADTLERFAREVRATLGERVREIVLFGSFARGDAHEESDVDVLVVVRELTPTEENAIVDIAYRVKSAAAEWISLTPLVVDEGRASELRARGRALFRDVAAHGVPL